MKPPKWTAFIAVAVALLASCATYNSTQNEVLTTNGVKNVTTQVHITTFFDAKSELQKLSLSTTDKNQRLGIGSLNQESTGTNIVNLFEAAARGSAQGAANALLPKP